MDGWGIDLWKAIWMDDWIDRRVCEQYYRRITKLEGYLNALATKLVAETVGLTIVSGLFFIR